MRLTPQVGKKMKGNVNLKNEKIENKEKNINELEEDEPPSVQNKNHQLNLNQKTTEKDAKPLRAAIYARVSSVSQINGYSLNEQIRICRKRCEVMKWKVRYVFREAGQSAKNADRPKFQMMLKKAERGLFNVLVFWKLDRFCRSLIDVVNFERVLKEHGVQLCSVTENLNTTSAYGKFTFQIIAIAAELERGLIRERSRLGMKGLAKSGRWPNATVPLGYQKRKDGTLKIYTKEATLVKKIFRMYTKLRSMPETAFQLNKMNIKTKQGNEWTATAVKRILDHRLYVGIYEVSDIIENFPEYRIIDDKIFDKAQKLRYRAKKVREAMPFERKKGVVNRIFDEYLAFLREEEQESICFQGVSAI